MTTLATAKAITLSLAIGLAQTAAADSFNDRGEDFLTQVKPGLPSAAVEGVASPSHFNDQSGDFPAHLKPGLRSYNRLWPSPRAISTTAAIRTEA